MAQHGKTGHLGAAAGGRLDGHREAGRARGVLPRILSLVVGLCLLVPVGSASPASAAAHPGPSGATAVWDFSDGCVETFLSMERRQTTASGAPRTFFFLTQSQTCDDPNMPMPVRSLEGVVVGGGGQLTVRPNFTAHLDATVPVTCSAFEAGACDQAPYDADSVSMHLWWATAGKVLPVDQLGTKCLYRYGTATGSIVLGGVDLLTLGGVTHPADPTETNVQRCVG